MATEPGGLTPGQPGSGTPGPLEPVRGSRPDPRIVLWRDSASILVAVVIALLAWQTFAPTNTGSPSDTGPDPSTIVVGSLPPGVTLPPGFTFGNVVPSNLPIDATPTPIVAITLGPSPSPSPTPSPSPKPSATPKPTKTPGPATPPPPTDTPPPATADFTYSETAPCVVDFVDASTGTAVSWDWTFGDGFGSSQQNPTHLYLTTGSYSVKLVVNGGVDSITKTVDVAGPCPT